MTKFAEDFDFEAMNEKFKKDEVWGHLGKSKKEKEGNDSDEDDYQEEYDTELPKMDVKVIFSCIHVVCLSSSCLFGAGDKINILMVHLSSVPQPIYDKDNFFDSISSNAADNDQTNGRTRFSEQMKIDAEV